MAVAKRKVARRTPSKATKAAKKYAAVAKKSKPGTGKRFAAMTTALKAKGAKNPKALAAYIGRRKYGAKRMASMAAKGRKR